MVSIGIVDVDVDADVDADVERFKGYCEHDGYVIVICYCRA